MFRLTRDDLLHIAPRPRQGPGAQIWDAYVAALTSVQGAALMASLSNENRLTNALAQMTCETNLSILWESGMYSWERIVEIFGPGHHSAAIGEIEARQIAALPCNPDGSGPRAERLFERAYGLGNPHKAHELGNTQKGDGYRFRGWGLDQITGRDAHEAAAKKLGITVDQMTTPIAAIAVFMFEWEQKGCNAYADKGDTISIRKLINTGSVRSSLRVVNGLPAAMQALHRAQTVITAADFSTAAPDPDREVATFMAPVNPDRPVSLMQSTEMQAGGGISTTTGLDAATKWPGCFARAFGKSIETGRFSLIAFALALLSDEDFMEATFMTLAAAGGIYMMIQRYKRYFVHGV